MRGPIRVATLMAFCALSWGAGASLAAAPAYASTCLPNGSTCPPDDFTGTIPGTLLASISGTLTASGSFTASYSEAVYLQNNTFCSGCLTFDLQVQNQPGSTDAIQQVHVGNFDGALTDMGYRSDGSTLAGGAFVDGTQIPTDVMRSTSGAAVAWDFTGPNSVNLLSPGTTSFVLVVETNATTFAAGTVSAQDGGTAQAAGFQPVVPTMSTTASPSVGPSGSRLQDSATLMNTSNLDGTGSITFSLYGAGDTSCAATPVHTETVTGVSSNGPYSTSIGFLAKPTGTYNWTASFSGDSSNAPATTTCGSEPVAITRTSQLTQTDTTCSQFAGGTVHAISKITYSTHNGKISAATPGGFAYWATVTSSGGKQTLSIDQFTNETSNPFLLSVGSSAYTAGCASVSTVITQSGGAVTVKFNGGSAGSTFFVGVVFSTSNVLGESKPTPSSMVKYLLRTKVSTQELDLVRSTA